MAKIAYGYGRKSRTREEVESDRYSPERQRGSVQNWCNTNGYTLGAYFEDAEGRRSGHTAQRPGWQELLATLAHSTPDAVVIEAVDRAGREMKLLVDFAKEMERRGIRLIFVQDGIDFLDQNDRMKFYMKAMFAEEEWEKISRRVQRTIARRREAHGCYWGPVPFGTARTKEGKLVPDLTGVWWLPVRPPQWTAEQPADDGWQWRGYHQALARLYDLYQTEEHGFAGLADKLNEEGWRYKARAKNGGTHREWRADDIRRCVHSWHLYAGDLTRGRMRRKDHGILVSDAWPPLLDLKVIMQVAQLVERRGAHLRGRPGLHRVYPLTPLLFCARCKTQMVAQTTRHGTRKYRHHHHSAGHCPAVHGTISAEEAEDVILDLLSLIAFPPAIEAMFQASAQTALIDADQSLESANLDATLAKLRKQRERLLDLYLEEALDRDQYLDRKAKLDHQIKQLEAQVVGASTTNVQAAEIVERMRQVSMTMRTVGPGEQKEMLGGMFKRLELDLDTKKLVYWPQEWIRPFF